jgi:cytochrome c biogenesis protein CcdA
MTHCHEEGLESASPEARDPHAHHRSGGDTLSGPGAGTASLVLSGGVGIPRPALVLGGLLGLVAMASLGTVALVPYETAAFGGLTVPLVIGSGLADGFNPCAFALLVLFATYTLTLVNAVTADGTPTPAARRTLLGAGSLYVGAVWITYFLIGLGLFGFLGWLGQDHIVARVASLLALVMALWMLKDVFLPGVGPSMMAPSGTHGWMNKAIQRGGLGGMLLAGVLVGICTVPCAGAIYLDILAVLHASGGGPVGLALLALYNLAFIVPLVTFLLFVSDRRVLGTLGRWNSRNGSAVKVVLAFAVVAMSFGLLLTM